MTEKAVVYTGPGKVCSRVGKSTGNEYVFTRDQYGKPMPENIEESDIEVLLMERGGVCASHPEGRRFFYLLEEWMRMTSK
jgi:hypothetical protein